MHTRPRADYEIVFNQAGGDADLAPTGSVKDYFHEASYGTVDLDSTVLAWVVLPHTEAYYANGDYDLEKGNNREDTEDLYFGGGVTTLNSTTTPSSQSYQGNHLRLLTWHLVF